MEDRLVAHETPLFAYGTLRVPAVVEELLGQRLRSVPARLHGYACYQVAEQWYPAIVAEATSSVPGQLLLGVTDRMLAELDEYEGDLYERRVLEVESSDATVCRAWCYVLAPGKEQLLSREPWDLEAFRRTKER